MKTFITITIKSQPLIVFVVLGSLILSGCSLVGTMGGLAVDSSNRKKHDKISSESQKIVLRYTEGRTLRGVYKGLEYIPEDVRLSAVSADNIQQNYPLLFPNIGEPIELSLYSDSISYKGRFGGLVQTNGQHHLILETESDSEYVSQNIAWEEVESLKMDNQQILSPFPDTDRIFLRYEMDNEIHSVPLDSLSHINYRRTKNVLYLGAAGLVIDAIIIISVSQSLSDFSLDW